MIYIVGMPCAVNKIEIKALHFSINIKVNKMKNISLVKVTFIVVATALASSLVSAKDVVQTITPFIDTPTSTSTQFEQLDLDNNSVLSLVEVQEYKIIYDAFTTIDLNSDATISKDEFTKYITK